MKDIIVTAKEGKEGAEVSISMKFPETLKEAIELYGEAPILSNALANWKITIQSAMRRYIKVGKKADEIQSLLGGLKMGTAIERVSDPKASFLSKFQAMTPEEKAAVIKELTEKAKATTAAPAAAGK